MGVKNFAYSHLLFTCCARANNRCFRIADLRDRIFTHRFGLSRNDSILDRLEPAWRIWKILLDYVELALIVFGTRIFIFGTANSIKNMYETVYK